MFGTKSEIRSTESGREEGRKGGREEGRKGGREEGRKGKRRTQWHAAGENLLGARPRPFCRQRRFWISILGFRICLGFRYWDFGFSVLVAAAGRVKSKSSMIIGNRECGIGNEQRGDAQKDRSHLEPAAWQREGGGGEPPRRVHQDFRIPHSLLPHLAPASHPHPDASPRQYAVLWALCVSAATASTVTRTAETRVNNPGQAFTIGHCPGNHRVRSRLSQVTGRDGLQTRWPPVAAWRVSSSVDDVFADKRTRADGPGVDLRKMCFCLGFPHLPACQVIANNHPCVLSMYSHSEVLRA